MDDLKKLTTQAQTAIALLSQQRNAAMDALVQRTSELAVAQAELAECQKALAAATEKEKETAGAGS